MPIFIAIAAVATVASGVAQYQGTQQAKKAAAAQRRIQQIQNMEDRRARLRQAIAARSSMTNAAAQTGVAGSSGVLGGMSSIQSQYGSAVAFSQATERMSLQAGLAAQKAANWQTTASTFGSLASLSMFAAGQVNPKTEVPNPTVQNTKVPTKLYGEKLGVFRQ